MGIDQFNIASAPDDGYWIDGTLYNFNSTSVSLYCGHDRTTYSGQELSGHSHPFLRFASVDINNGALINSADLALYCPKYIGGDAATHLVRFFGVASDNPDAPTNYSEASAMPLTSASVDWTTDGPWSTAFNPYNPPDLSPIIQEIVSRPGWRNENALIIVMKHISPEIPPGTLSWTRINPGELLSVLTVDHDGGTYIPPGIPKAEELREVIVAYLTDGAELLSDVLLPTRSISITIDDRPRMTILVDCSFAVDIVPEINLRPSGNLKVVRARIYKGSIFYPRTLAECPFDGVDVKRNESIFVSGSADMTAGSGSINIGSESYRGSEGSTVRVRFPGILDAIPVPGESFVFDGASKTISGVYVHITPDRRETQLTGE